MTRESRARKAAEAAMRTLAVDPNEVPCDAVAAAILPYLDGERVERLEAVVLATRELVPALRHGAITRRTIEAYILDVKNALTALDAPKGDR